MFWFNKINKQKRLLELEKSFRWKYENLRNLLRLNSDLMETMSDIQSYTGDRIPDDSFTHHQISNLIDGTEMMIENLNCLADDEFFRLYKTLRSIAGKIQSILLSTKITKIPQLLLPLNLVSRGLIGYAGGKAGNLGELKNVISISRNIPEGFVITTAAYHMLLNDNNLTGQLRALYSKIDVNNLKEAETICARAKEFVVNSIIPDAITTAIENHLKYNGSSETTSWAVRSSAVGEDGEFSYAGQFESVLNVPKDKLPNAYLKVIASRFNTNAVLFRLMKNIRESESPMAVLFIPMVNAATSGVIYTANPLAPDDNNVVVSAVRGLAADLVAGKVPADTFYVNRDNYSVSNQIIADKRTVLSVSYENGIIKSPVPQSEQMIPAILAEQLKELVRISLLIEDHFGSPQDIEWVISKDGSIYIIQSRLLRINELERDEKRFDSGCKLLIEGGVTISPGIAQGQLQYIDSISELNQVKDRVILLTKHAQPELVSVFSRISGLICETGHPTGHAATLAREFRIPTLFDLANAKMKLRGIVEIGLDATRKKLYAGLPWPNLPQKELKRTSEKSPKTNPLDELIFDLNLIDPGASDFSPQGCSSLHDVIRYVHQMSVTVLFDLGDSQVEKLKDSFKTLDSPIPLFLTVLNIGNAIDDKYDKQKKIPPEGINSIPFQSLWRGLSDPEIRWTGRQNINLSGLASVVMSSAAGGGQSGRQMGDRNYLIVGPEYINLNARLAYHYSMIDALVCDRSVNNYITFRFRGGGASRNRRGFRARFLTGVLLSSGFSVDMMEDSVTARLRGYSRKVCEEKLEILGKLTGCARQLDMLLDSKETVKQYIDRFLNSDYSYFH